MLHKGANEHVLGMLARDQQTVSESFETVTRRMKQLGFGRGWPIFGIVFLPSALEKELKSIWQATVSLRSKVVQEFIENPSIRNLFGFTGEEVELILSDPILRLGDISQGSISGFSLIQVARPDGFLTPNFNPVWRSNEANTGEPGGLDYHDTIGNAMWETPLMREVRQKFAVRKFSLLQEYTWQAQRLFFTWQRKTGIKGAVVVLCTEIDREAKLIAGAVRQVFPETVIATLTDKAWRFKNGRLYLNNTPVGLLVRATAADITAIAEANNAVTQALLNSSVCAFPNLCGRVGGNKVTDYLLTCNRLSLNLTRLEQLAAGAIAKTFPAESISSTEALQLQNKLVLKPNLGGGGLDNSIGKGIDVTLGATIGAKEWQRLVEYAAEGDTRVYLLQELLEQRMDTFVSLQNEVSAQEYEVVWCLDPYLINGKHVGYGARGQISPNSRTVKLNVGDGTAHSGCIYTVG